MDGWMIIMITTRDIRSNQGMSEIITERLGKTQMDQRGRIVIRNPPREGRVGETL